MKRNNPRKLRLDTATVRRLAAHELAEPVGGLPFVTFRCAPSEGCTWRLTCGNC